MIAIDLSKQQVLYVDLKPIQQINFTENTTMLFIYDEAKETASDFSQGTVEVS